METRSAVSSTETNPRTGPPGFSLRVGSRLLRDAWSEDGTLLLRAGTRIRTPSELDRLLRPDVRFGSDKSKALPLDVANEAALDAGEFVERREQAKAVRNEAVEDVRDVFRRIEATGQVDMDRAEKAAHKLTASLTSDPRAMVSLMRLKDADSYTFTHSVNVGILATYLALHTEHHPDVEEIAVGALLHDVGKVGIPTEILHKPGPLTADEMRVMKTHPLVGAEQLRACGEKRHTVVSCVLSHHEKMGGGGYPEGRKGPQIAAHAMITAIADIYDALTTDRPYRTAYNPRDALDLMARRMNEDLDPALFGCFKAIMGLYPVGSEVILSDGRAGTVMNHYATAPDRPSVLISSAAEDTDAPQPQVVDLSVTSALSVKGFTQPGRCRLCAPPDVEQMRLAA